MTEPMWVLYHYTTETSFQALLQNDRYHMRQTEAGQVLDQLRRRLPDDLRALLDSYEAAVSQQQHLELEAMFESAFTLRRNLD